MQNQALCRVLREDFALRTKVPNESLESKFQKGEKMKSTLRITLTALALAGLLAACTMGAQPTSDANAINTAVAGTQQAQALGQATVNANVLTAMPATPTPGPTIDYVTLTEE